MADAKMVASAYYNIQPAVLASASPVRRRLFENAGIEIEAVHANVNETIIRETLIANDNTIDPGDVAEILARAKADNVGLHRDTGVIIATD